MKIWSITTEDDYGLNTLLFNDKEKAEAARRHWLLGHFDKDPDLSNDEMLDVLSCSVGFNDTISIGSHDIHPPFHAENSLEDIMIRNVPGQCDGELEVDGNAIISWGEDPGAYVQAWVWVYFDSVEQDMTMIEPDGRVSHFEEFREFMTAWDHATPGSIYRVGTTEL